MQQNHPKVNAGLIFSSIRHDSPDEQICKSIISFVLSGWSALLLTWLSARLLVISSKLRRIRSSLKICGGTFHPYSVVHMIQVCEY